MLAVASVVARLETARAEANQREQAIRRLFELTDLLIEDRPLSEVLELIVSTVHEAFALRSVRPPAARRCPSRRGGLGRRTRLGRRAATDRA